MNCNSGIYQIQSKCRPNRKYIGSAINFSKRWCKHLHILRYGKHFNKKLQNHYNKYGEDDLIFSIILTCDPIKETLLAHEQFFIDAYKPYFNILEKAGSVIGYKHTEEDRIKMRRIVSEESRKRMSESHKGKIPWNKGKKGLQIAWNKGIPLSEETKKKMSINGKGKISWCTGKKLPPLSEEHKRKISIANKGRKISEEQRQKFIKLITGRKASDECRKKMSDSHKGQIPWSAGKHLSQETKLKISKSLTGRVGYWRDKKRGKWTDQHKRRIGDSVKKYNLKHKRQEIKQNDGTMNFEGQKT